MQNPNRKHPCEGRGGGSHHTLVGHVVHLLQEFELLLLVTFGFLAVLGLQIRKLYRLYRNRFSPTPNIHYMPYKTLLVVALSNAKP